MSISLQERYFEKRVRFRYNVFFFFFFRSYAYFMRCSLRIACSKLLLAFHTVFISTKFTEFQERRRTMDTNLSALEHRTYIRTRDTLTRPASNLN